VSGWIFVQAAWGFLNNIFDHAVPVLARHGLHQKSLVLLALLDVGDTPQELAQLLRTPASTLSHMLRDLEEKNLIKRSLDAQDKRKFRLRRTTEGQKALDEGIAAVENAVAEQFAKMNSTERETLQVALPLLLRLSQSESQ